MSQKNENKDELVRISLVKMKAEGDVKDFSFELLSIHRSKITLRFGDNINIEKGMVQAVPLEIEFRDFESGYQDSPRYHIKKYTKLEKRLDIFEHEGAISVRMNEKPLICFEDSEVFLTYPLPKNFCMLFKGKCEISIPKSEKLDLKGVYNLFYSIVEEEEWLLYKIEVY